MVAMVFWKNWLEESMFMCIPEKCLLFTNFKLFRHLKLLLWVVNERLFSTFRSSRSCRMVSWFFLPFPAVVLANLIYTFWIDVCSLIQPSRLITNNQNLTRIQSHRVGKDIGSVWWSFCWLPKLSIQTCWLFFIMLHENAYLDTKSCEIFSQCQISTQ